MHKFLHSSLSQQVTDKEMTVSIRRPDEFAMRVDVYCSVILQLEDFGTCWCSLPGICPAHSIDTSVVDLDIPHMIRKVFMEQLGNRSCKVLFHASLHLSSMLVQPDFEYVKHELTWRQDSIVQPISQWYELPRLQSYAHRLD